MTSSKLGTDTKTGETVYLHKASRRQGTYFIAATGVGKSTSLRYLIEQDIKQGIGVCVLDPHGDLINDVIGSLHRKEDRERVLLLDAQDKHRKFGINLYQCDDPSDDELVTNTFERVEHIFKLVWGEDIAKMPLVMQGIQNSTYTFIDSFPDYRCTMLEIPMLFREDTPRANMVAHLQDDNIQAWWQYYHTVPQGVKDELARMVVNKVEGFTTNRLLKPIIGQSRSTIDFRQVIDSTDGKIVLIKMFGNNEKLTQLIGSLVIAQILGAALSRQDKARDERRQFHIYADEFELYATEDFTRLLKECRKYGIGVTLAHQSREGISNRNKAASLQVANIISGRIIPDDAKDIAGMFDTAPSIVETRKEQELAITTNPVEWFRQGKGHRNWRVVELVAKHLTPLFVEIEKHSIPAYFEAPPRTKEYYSPDYIELLNNINRFLVHAMRDIPISAENQQALLIDILLGFGKNYYKSYRVEEGLELTSVFEADKVDFYPQYGKERKLHLVFPTKSDMDKAIAMFTASYQGNGVFLTEVEKFLAKIRYFYHLKKMYLQAQKRISQFFDTTKCGFVKEIRTQFLVPISYPSTTQEIYRYAERSDIIEKKALDGFHIRAYLEEMWAIYGQQDYEESLRDILDGNCTDPVAIDRRKQAWLQAQHDVALIESLIADWDELAQLLSLEENKIKIACGQWEEKEIKQGRADRKLEIENELVGLPVGVAWCRVQKAAGELEEHVIKLATSETRLAYTNEVEKWIEEIKEQMLKKCYLRSITDVEKEISDRHALLRLPPKPPEPALLPPDKPDEPPSSPRRKKIA